MTATPSETTAMTTKTEFIRDIERGLLPAHADCVRAGGAADDYDACMQKHFDRLWDKYGASFALAAVPAAPQVAAPAPITRFNPIQGLGMNPHATGLYVYYADHIAALARAAAPVVDGGAAPADMPMVSMTPPATSRDRWMYRQGWLAALDPRSHAAAPAPVDGGAAGVRGYPSVDLPEWTRFDDLGGRVPSEVRMAMREHGNRCVDADRSARAGAPSASGEAAS
jgi:hypothetical protein